MGLFNKKPNPMMMTGGGGGGMRPPMGMMPQGPSAPFRNMSSPMSSPFPMGHVPPQMQSQARVALSGIIKQLGMLKGMQVLGPRGGAVEKYLMCLTKALEPMAIIGGPQAGMRDWMVEVQIFISLLRSRIYQKQIPLQPMERQAIMQATQMWMSSRGGGTDLSAPQAQIVIHALREMATR